MATLTANDFAAQMVAQARVLDPSFSGEVGTPERAIIDTVAQSLADSQVDLAGVQGALDIDSKYGTNLDRFTALFGFQRQQAAAATGYVTFSRITPALQTTTIPSGTTLQASTNPDGTGTPVQYTTTASGSIAINATTSGAIPIQAVVTGSVGNAAANTITAMVGNPPPGVTSVTNPNALTNGTDPEDDNSYKVRFKNTWARNLAGTSSQYLALALSGAFTTKANVIGVQSRYQEYVQVPDYDDAGFLEGTQYIGQVPPGNQDMLGIQGQWTTPLSLIPYAKQIFTDVQTFVSNGQQGAAQYYYRPGTDFQFNYPALITGDVIREVATVVNASGVISAGGNLIVESVTGLPTSGTLLVVNRAGIVPTEVSYTGLTTSPESAFTGINTGITVAEGDPVYLVPLVTQVAPNFTLLNVFNPPSPSVIPGLQALAPGDIILTEFSYVSSASRNDINHNVTNAIDVYVDGANDMLASAVFLPSANQIFNINPNSPWYYENFRRDGEPTKRPQVNNYMTPLYQSPLDGLPSTINIGGANYYLGVHYWLVHEIDTLGGSIRARDGIEWSAYLEGDTGDFPPPTNALAPYYPTGSLTFAGQALTPGTVVEVDDYLFDANIPTLQASIEAARQITTDALVHKAVIRYFKLDITVIYSANANFTAVNVAIGTAVQAYMQNQYFGTIIQLSTLLEVIHQVSGVDNVRWSNDLPIVPDLIRVLETDINGDPLHGASIDRLLTDPSDLGETQTLYIVGNPQGTFRLSWTDPALPGPTHTVTTDAISFTDATGAPVSATVIEDYINLAMIAASVPSGVYYPITVTQDVRPTTNVSSPIISFTLTYGAPGTPYLPSITQTITASTYAFDEDFLLLDDQLPSLAVNALATDTVPGMIIRPRAQSSFYRPGLG